jgi:SAM-dependent methyltransferase
VAVAGRVIAVEPVAAMREALVAAVPSAAAVEGTAEAIPLPDASVDAVTVAQAFHWFDGERALREIRRVLVPSGKLGIVFNARDESVAWVAALGALLDEEASGAPRHKTGAWRAAFDAPDSPFEPLERATFRHEQVLDAEGLAARVASISYVAAMHEDDRQRLLAAVQRLVAEHGLNAERVVLPYRTDVYWCAARRSAAGS